MVATAVIFHQVALFASTGWAAALVPPAFMAFAGASVLMTYATGFLLERIPSRFGVALAMAFTVAAVAERPRCFSARRRTMRTCPAGASRGAGAPDPSRGALRPSLRRSGRAL
jgi:hypothetical protein